MKKVVAVVLSILLLAGVFMTGCGQKAAEQPKDTAKTEANKPAEQPNENNSSEPAEKQTDKKIVIGSSLLTLEHQFFLDIKASLEQTAKANNVELITRDARFDLSRQLADIEDFITQKVDAIVMSPVDPDGVKNAIDQAKAAKIPIITIDTAAKGVEVDCHVATDNLEGGKMAGELMAKLLNGKGNVVMIDYPLASTTLDRAEGFNKAIANYPGIKLIAQQSGKGLQEPSMITMENLLQAHDNIDGVFAVGDPSALGALAAIEAAGRDKDIIIIGYDATKEAQEIIKAGNRALVADVQQYPDQIGKLGLEAAIKIVKGEKVEKYIPIKPGMFTKDSK
ncbi:MAG: ABC-type sugar transport system, periplasmic component [Thermoanaerobacter sp.]|jgi:ribose transport system substrate-binding protein|nr:ABC-type sugar transport system, periplasmic component [Thermoanaerobacter sp.]